MNADDLRANRELNTGFASALSRAFEFAATVAAFCGLGWVIDRWAGTGPVFVIALAVVALVGQFVRMWYSYDAEMRMHEARLASHQVAPPTKGGP